MNVLMFTRCIGAGGTEKVIFQLCKALKETNNNVIVCAATGEGVDTLKKMGVEYIQIPDIQKKSPKVFKEVLNTIVKTIDEQHIEIVHTHHRMAAMYMVFIKRMRKVKTLNTIHNTFDDKKTLTRIAFNNTFNIAVGSSVATNMINDYRINSRKIDTIYNAIDNDNVIDEKNQTVDSLKNDYFLVGNIGRINTQKGFEYFVDAAEIIKKSSLPIKMLIIGDGILRKEIEEMVHTRHLEDVVYFLGFQTNILSLISQMDLIVLSSLWEGFPLTPIETFSMGKTIVATDVPGTMEIVENGYNGLVVPKQSGEAIAEAVVELYTDEEKRKLYQKNAIETYNNKFSYRAFCKKYLDVYDRLLKG